jgi:hypothetical protein
MDIAVSFSTSARFSATGAFVIFLKPLEFHLELANLLEQFRLQLLSRFFLLRPATRKKIGQLFHQMVPPQPYLVGMDAELARNLGERLLPLGRLKSPLALKVASYVFLIFVSIPYLLRKIWQAQKSTLATCPVFGE